MVEETFNAGADPEQPITQAEAEKLFTKARPYAYPSRTLGSFKLLYITDPDQPGAMDAMKKMYELYEKIFPIEEERESFDNLVAALRRNKANDGSNGDAPSREQWVMVENEQGEIVAANNSMVFSASNHPEASPYVSGTTHLNYTFVDPAYRGQGHAERATGYSYDKAREFIASTFKDGRKPSSIPMLEFAEQNSVLKMTPEEILVDTAGAQTDQSKRRDIFEKWGFRELDLPSPYVQLPLVPRDQGGESAAGMDLVCRGVPAPVSFMNIPAKPVEVPSSVIKFHLHQFMKQAVSKGAYDIETDPDWVKQAQALDRAPTVKVMTELNHMGLKDKIWNALDGIVHAQKFDADTFSHKPMSEIIGVGEVSPKATVACTTDVVGKSQPRIEWTIAS